MVTTVGCPGVGKMLERRVHYVQPDDSSAARTLEEIIWARRENGDVCRSVFVDGWDSGKLAEAK